MKLRLKPICALLVALVILPAVTQAVPLKLDFGTSQSQVFPGFTRVSEATLFTSDSTFGFVNTAPNSYDRLRPNALASDFIWPKGKVTFRVNLPDGDYKAWFMYGDSRYGARVIVPLAQKNVIAVNGKAAFADTIDDWKEFYTEKYYFRGYSNIYHANEDFYDTYIAPNFKEATIPFTVKGGKVLFTFEDIPLSAMVIYSVNEAAQVEDDIDYLHSELRRYTVVNEVAPDNLYTEPTYSAADKARGYVVYSRFSSKPPFAQDRPLMQEMNPTPSTFLSSGQKANVSLTILPLEDLKDVKVSISDFTNKASGAKLSASDIKLQRVAHQAITKDPKISKLQTATYSYQIAPEFIKPFTGNFSLMDKGINRTFLITFSADKNTPAGIYDGKVTITPQNAPARDVPIRVRILPITLPELPIIAGRYAMDYDFYYYYYWNRTFTDQSFRDYVWAREKQNMQWTKEMGLNSIAWTEARPGAISQRDPNLEPNEQFLYWMDLYRDMGFKAMPWYGFQAITTSTNTYPDHPRFSPEWTKQYRELITHIRDIGKQRNWPEIVFYLSDELSNRGAEGGADGLKRAEASKGISGIRRISSVNGKFEQPLIGKVDILMPNFAFPITEPILNQMKAKDTELWLYNVTDQRFTWGYYPFRTGAKGRFQWFANYGPGYPFDDFDSTAGNTTWDAFVNGPDGPISMINALDMREGLDDLRYATLLRQLVETANPTNKAIAEGKAILAEINALDVDLRNYTGTGVSAQDTGFAASDKMWSPEKCERMRWRMAEAIMALQEK